jgi:hypothetical protein
MTLRKDSHEVTVKGLAKLVGISPGSMRKALSRKHQDQDCYCRSEKRTASITG